MKKIIIIATILFFTTDQSYAQEVRLSFKVILDETTGNRPSYATETYFDNAVNFMNNVMSKYDRGISFSREPTILLGGINHPISIKYSDINPFDPSDPEELLEADAQADPTAYAWRQNRINIYFNNGGNGGVCSFPEADEVILIGAVNNDGSLLMHEIGHFFNLCHTQGCPCGGCDDDDNPPFCMTVPGDDDIDDTLPDLACWDRDDIAQWSFSQNYSQLSSNRMNQVDNVWFNLMSYHNITGDPRLTTDQLDKWQNAIWQFDNRQDVARGEPIFVDGKKVICIPLCIGTPLFEFATFAQGYNRVNSSQDVIILREDDYNITNTTYTKACLIVATEEGDAIIK